MNVSAASCYCVFFTEIRKQQTASREGVFGHPPLMFVKIADADDALEHVRSMLLTNICDFSSSDGARWIYMYLGKDVKQDNVRIVVDL